MACDYRPDLNHVLVVLVVKRDSLRAYSRRAHQNPHAKALDVLRHRHKHFVKILLEPVLVIEKVGSALAAVVVLVLHSPMRIHVQAHKIHAPTGIHDFPELFLIDAKASGDIVAAPSLLAVNTVEPRTVGLRHAVEINDIAAAVLQIAAFYVDIIGENLVNGHRRRLRLVVVRLCVVHDLVIIAAGRESQSGDKTKCQIFECVFHTNH